MRIRPFDPRDRAAVRALACDTADRGEPIGRLFPDRELLADLLTCYYTDEEPDALWVAEDDREVVGYLTGCLRTTRYARLMAQRIVPGSLARALWRGTFASGQIWRVIGAGRCREKAAVYRGRDNGDNGGTHAGESGQRIPAGL